MEKGAHCPLYFQDTKGIPATKSARRCTFALREHVAFVARSAEEEARRARRYGRRHRVLRAQGTADESVMIDRLVRELKRSSMPTTTQKRLLAGLRKYSDVRRKRAAVWAIVEALESL